MKISHNLKFMTCPHRRGVFKPVRTFFRKKKGERGSTFRDYVETFFMDGPLVKNVDKYSNNFIKLFYV